MAPRTVLSFVALLLLQAPAFAQDQSLRIDKDKPPVGITAPKLLPSNQTVRYPPIALRCSAEGDASVDLTVLPSGEVADPKIAASTGYGVLDDASLDFVRSSHYSPAMKDGRPIAVRMTRHVIWRLAGQRHAVLDSCLKALRAGETPPA